MTRNRELSNRGEMTGYRRDTAAPLKSLDFFSPRLEQDL